MKSSKMINILKQGNIVIPLYLMQNRKEFKLKFEEFVFLMYLYNKADDASFNPEQISKDLNITTSDVMNYIGVLSSKNFIKIETFKNEKNILEEKISLEGFYKKITLLMGEEVNKPDVENSNIFEIVEKEFGRTLSPIEYEIMKAWIESGFTEEIMKEAVKEATFNGVSNLRYIDKILYEWNKAGIKTKEDVEKNRQRHIAKKEEEEEPIDIVDFDWFEEDDDDEE